MNDISTVHRANQTDLFYLLQALHEKLPDSCMVYFNVLSQISVPSNRVRIYFTKSHDQCTAVIGVRRETFDLKQISRTSWILNEWYLDDNDLLKIYKVMDFIDWNKDSLKIFGEGFNLNPAVRQFLDDRQVQITDLAVSRFTIDPSKALQCQLHIPSNMYIKNLEHCHAAKVWQFWPYRERSSVEEVADEIQRLPSVGLFLKENDQLVSWVVSAFPDALGKLHTLEQYRHQGYAKLVVQHLSKHLAMAGYMPFANFLVQNEASRRTFESAGFEFHSQGHISVSLLD